MSNIDFDKLKSMTFALPEYDLRPMQSHIAQLNRQQEQAIRAIEQAREEKEALLPRALRTIKEFPCLPSLS